MHAPDAPSTLASSECSTPRTISGKTPSARSVQRSHEYADWLLNRDRRRYPHRRRHGDVHIIYELSARAGSGLFPRPA